MTAPTPRGPVVARAPGRVNLIGDHTDYCGGLAMPMAIDRWTEVAFHPEPGARRLTLTTDVDPAPAVVDLDDRTAVDPGPGGREGGGGAAGDGEGGEGREGAGGAAGGGESGGGTGRADGTPAGAPSWRRLAAAVVALVAPATGGRAAARSSVPLGAGLSSSAAFSVALALALGAGDDPVTLARLCQRAEAAAGSEVGLLDPLAIVGARAGHAMLIDFGTLAWHHVPVPAGTEVVVVHSGVGRRLAGSPYRLRRAECEAAAACLDGALGAASEADVGRLADPVLRARARHVVTECRRVRDVARALADGDLRAAGAAMTESHRSLAGDFASSTPEMDALVVDLTATAGVHGARMTGGGFGGCAVALTEPGALDPARWPGRCWVVRPAGPTTRTAGGAASDAARLR